MTLQRHSHGSGGPLTAPPIVHDVLRSPGQPLDTHTRAFFEPRFGYDFSRVQVHTHTKAAESAQAVSALAYTVGRDIVFGAGQYAPRTTEGQRLLAHELMHVVQQRDVMMQSKANVEVGPPRDAHEQAADRAADAIVAGGSPKLTLCLGRIAGLMIQRQPLVKPGDVGCPVPELQDALNATGEALVVDGKFGPLTEAGVTRFQVAHPPLVVNGRVGPLTWPALHLAAPGNHGLPAGELTNSHGWGAGANATIHRWRQQLTPDTTSFHHCRVREVDPGGGTDTCHFPGSAFAPFTAVTGGTWDVNARNFWGDDFVGWFAPAVTFYRANGRAPCSASFPQSMRVVRPGGDVQYQLHQLTATIGATTVSSTRAGQTQTKPWP